MKPGSGTLGPFLRQAGLIMLYCVFFSASNCMGQEPVFPGDALSPWGDKGVQKKGFPACTVLIRVTGLDPPSGILRLAMYDSRQSYEARKDPVRSAAVEVKGRDVTLKFDGLPPGDYAIMMYHDANRNNRFDRILGLPREQFGFSNNAKPGLGPPDFDRVRFHVQAGRVTFLTIRAQ